ncbi:uncharacterized protein L3040_001108 [Drepanopeziza brunnea f. sp. 'multigermtubi']|uniref:DUF3074 domain-containing protein n=1 Tax=Marssonina brunnea f. sp. multigermtubi (strain MB_m1) TaxID=1072389 RepID=K1XVT9_MARBU|nr:uncharacterized protein MBM_05293 [Drepanopeziza brunnea f. sp. 'multigermtubi' MB_m1]EKD16824.1 hypothetical protein MBM_05293 [Drepanopeziza brunnea f. sp. 'multigermtubi' MB_m1]KAJ5054846.1 hypothetical protein L3040_001108 [Drepanopeziza brunnea f. sp. 'multigermtubi']
MAGVLGPWVRLEGISISQLPAGGKGIPLGTADPTPTSPQEARPSAPPPLSLQSFVQQVLSESLPFIDNVAPKYSTSTSTGTSTGTENPSSLWRPKGAPRTYDASAAPVHVYERVVSRRELDDVEGISKLTTDRKDETWFCRRSCHRDAAEPGTASWAEFVHAFKEYHAESEQAFTPTIIGHRRALSWDFNGVDVEAAGERWTDVTVVVEEMTHRIDPKPLKNRTFPVLQLCASLAGTREFVVASIPIHDFHKSPYAEYARDSSLVVARYAAVERIRVLPGEQGEEIEWIMGTASDAGGVLPQWLQNLAVPGAVAKDVDMFLRWIQSQRK